MVNGSYSLKYKHIRMRVSSDGLEPTIILLYILDDIYSLLSLVIQKVG